MKNKLFTIYIFIFLIAGLLISVFHQDITFSNAENRNLAKHPKLEISRILSGKYESDFDEWVSDQFALRNNAISLKSEFQKLILQSDNSRVYFGKDYYLIDKSTVSDDQKLNVIINSINNFSNRYNGNIETMIIPSSALVNDDKLPAYANDLRKESFEKINRRLNSKITNINIIKELKNAKFQTFYRNDHHWTSDSAYLAYQKWAKANNLKAISKDKFKINVVSKKFIGATYSKALPFNYKYDKIKQYAYDNKVTLTYSDTHQSKSLYNDDALKKKDKYLYFTGVNDSLITINTSVKNGKNLLLIKDSFANCYLPFLVNHYENIYVVDPRYYNAPGNFLDDYHVDDILILYNIDNLMDDEYLPLFLDSLN